MATANSIPTASENLPLQGKVTRARKVDPTPTLFPDVPPHRDSGPCTLLPPGSVPERVGIARLASSSPLADAKRGTEYFLLPAKSILNHCDSTRVRRLGLFITPASALAIFFSAGSMRRWRCWQGRFGRFRPMSRQPGSLRLVMPIWSGSTMRAGSSTICAR